MAGTDPREARSSPGIPGSGNVLAANRLVLLAAVPLFLILAVAAYLTIQFGINERAAQGWVRHTYDVMRAARELQIDLQTAESSQRGYIIDRDPAYYRSYLAAAARVPGDLRRFREVTRDNPAHQQRAQLLQKLFADRV